MQKSSNITLEEISPNVFLFLFKEQYDLAMSFVRIQEFYESPKFKNKYFTLETFIDYWAKDFGKGSFDYPIRWGGFNVHGKAFSRWIKLFVGKKDVRSRENRVMDMLVAKMGDRSVIDWDNIYIIATTMDNKNTIVDHELAHAYYKIYPKYRKWCDAELKKLDPVDYCDSMERLHVMGYCDNVLKDEMQAYFSVKSTNPKNLKIKKVFVKYFRDFKKSLK